VIGSRGMWSRHGALLALSLLFLAANVTFFFWYRATMRERRSGLEERRAALEREVHSVEQEATRLGSQRERLFNVNAAIQEFYGSRVGTTRDTLAVIVDEVHGLLKRAVIAAPQIAYATRPTTDLPLTEMVVNFGFKSDYLRFKQLLGLIETDRRWIVVRDIGLSRDPETPGAVQVRMALATYFSTREPAPAPSPPPGASVPAGSRRR
jgi:hypothetical protein